MIVTKSIFFCIQTKLNMPMIINDKIQPAQFSMNTNNCEIKFIEIDTSN